MFQRLMLLGTLSRCLTAQPMPADASLADIRADEADRDKREKLGEIARALAIQAGSTLADIGTGYGYYAVRFSKLVGPEGRIVAQEIDVPLVEKLRDRIRSERLENIEPVLGGADDPGIFSYSVNAILIADVYHEVDNPVRFLQRLKASLEPGGRLMIIDYLKPEMQSKTREEQRKDHNIGPQFVEEDLKAAGFAVVEKRNPLGVGYDDIPIYYIVAKAQ